MNWAVQLMYPSYDDMWASFSYNSARMAGFPMAPSQPCHTRSISLPSRSHPIAHSFVEKLHKLRNNINTISLAPELMQDALRELVSLSESMEGLLCLPSYISATEKMMLEKELDDSIRLLDLCCIIKDGFAMKKEHIKDLQLALRRRDYPTIQSKAYTFIRYVKKAEKDIQNCLRSVKQDEEKCIDTESGIETTANFLMEVKAITIFLLQLVSSFLSVETRRGRSGRWSFVAKAFSKKKVADNREHELNFFSNLQHIMGKDVDEERTQEAQNQLQALEVYINGIENVLTSLFRQMIQSRVALLNILSS